MARIGGVAVLAAAILGPGAAEAGQAVSIGHFVPPRGCVHDERLAIVGLAIQACVHRFSPTHEFIILLRQTVVRPSRPDRGVDAALARQAVLERVREMRQHNAQLPGQELAYFAHSMASPAHFPPGASYCETVNFIETDHRVPAHEGREFRIGGQSFICARIYPDAGEIVVLDLRASERFPVGDDPARRRFERREPAREAFAAQGSLRFGAAPVPGAPDRGPRLHVRGARAIGAMN